MFEGTIIFLSLLLLGEMSGIGAVSQQGKRWKALNKKTETIKVVFFLLFDKIKAIKLCTKPARLELGIAGGLFERVEGVGRASVERQQEGEENEEMQEPQAGEAGGRRRATGEAKKR